MQSKRDSLKETMTNILIGYTVAFISQLLVFPLVGVEASYSQNFKIGAYFTVISFIRGYLVRRFFNKKEVRK